jgi:hypothetical protein
MERCTEIRWHVLTDQTNRQGNTDPSLGRNVTAYAGLDRPIAARPSFEEPIRQALLVLVEAND